MATPPASEFPAHVTVLTGIGKRYAAAVMEWDSIEERYAPSQVGFYGTRDMADKQAKSLADMKGLEVR